MNRGTSLTVIAVGAIFAFAITASLRFPTRNTDGPTEPIGDPVAHETIEEYIDQ